MEKQNNATIKREMEDTDYVIHDIRIKSKRGTGIAVGLYDPNNENQPSSLLVCAKPSFGAAKTSSTQSNIHAIHKGSMKTFNNVYTYKMEPGVYSVTAEDTDKLKVEVFGSSSCRDGVKGQLDVKTTEVLPKPPASSTTTYTVSIHGIGTSVAKHVLLNKTTENLIARPYWQKSPIIPLPNKSVQFQNRNTCSLSNNSVLNKITPASNKIVNIPETVVKAVSLGQAIFPQLESSHTSSKVHVSKSLPLNSTISKFLAEVEDKPDDLVYMNVESPSSPSQEIEIQAELVGFVGGGSEGQESSRDDDDDIADDVVYSKNKDVPFPVGITDVRTTSKYFKDCKVNGGRKVDQDAKRAKSFGLARCVLKRNLRSKSRSQKCERCDKAFFGRHDLLKHRKVVHGLLKPPVCCSQCGKTFQNRRVLRYHQFSHVSEKLSKCKKCDLAFKRNESLRIHMLSVHAEVSVRPYKFSHGKRDRGFIQRPRLQTHKLKKRRRPKDAAIRCDVCGKCFTTRSGLKLHEPIHLKVKPYSCDKCDKSFNQRPHLQAHKLKEHGEGTPYLCGECGRSFNRKDTLKNHVRCRHTDEKPHMSIHLKLKPYSCDKCDKRFNQRPHLQAHKLKEHGDGTPHLCGECGRSFNRKDTLKAHVRCRHTDEKPHMSIHLKLKPYSCDKCDKSFNQRPHLQAHKLKEHGEGTPYLCDECGKSFNRKDTLQAHVRCRHTDDKPHMCPICGKSFAERYMLRNHRCTHPNGKEVAANHSELPNYKCDQCGRDYKYRSNLNLHMKRKHSDKKYKCVNCEKSYALEGDLKRHFLIHSEKNDLTCNFCVKVFLSKSDLDDHRKIHHRGKALPCDEPGCEKTFFRMANLTEHKLRIHEKPFKCLKCNEKFAAKKRIRQHMFESHAAVGVLGKSFMCEYCGNSYPTNFVLKKHLREHCQDESPRYFVCRLCAETLPEKSALSEHVKLHMVECQFKCDKCEKSFGRKESLAHHQLGFHSNNTPYLCHHCGKGFTRRGNYNIHLNTHTGEKQYKCDHEGCGRIFPRKDALILHKRRHDVEYFTCEFCHKKLTTRSREKHMKIHSGEKPFRCNYCVMAFRIESSLIRHERTHTGERPFQCPVCSRAFTRKDQLHSHWRKLHSKS